MKFTKYLLLAVALLSGLAAFASTPSQFKYSKADLVTITQFKAKLALDDLVKSMKVKAESHNGELELSGTVDSNQKLERILTIAQSIDSVKQVHADNLQVRNTLQQRQDIMIQAAIKGQLIKRKVCQPKSIYANKIEVHSKRGNVTLHGVLKSHHAQSKTINIAAKTLGVKRVDSSQLIVTRY